MGRGTLLEVQYGLEDPPRSPGRVRGPSRRSGMGRGTLLEVRDASRDPPRGKGRVQ